MLALIDNFTIIIQNQNNSNENRKFYVFLEIVPGLFEIKILEYL